MRTTSRAHADAGVRSSSHFRTSSVGALEAAGSRSTALVVTHSSGPFSLCYDVAVPPVTPDVHAALARIAAAAPGLRMLVLHGSRARDEAHAGSDWDFAYEADPAFDADTLLAALADALKADRIDLVDLHRAGALLRHRVASDGLVLFERSPGHFDRFHLNAARTWCDLAPVLEPIYERIFGDAPPMSPLDRAVLAERSLALERHLARVAQKLPAIPDALAASSDASDSVILHLWQATQIVIDLAVAACVAHGAGTPQSYADAFRRLQATGIIEQGLADRLVRAAGFRNVIAHAYEGLDMARVHQAASDGPADLRAFLVAVARAVRSTE